MTTCSYARNLNKQTMIKNYGLLTQLKALKDKQYSELMALILDDNSDDSEISQKKLAYDNNVIPPNLLLNIECCADEGDNKYFYNIDNQSCVIPIEYTNFSKYTGMTTSNIPIDYYNPDIYTTFANAETECAKICSNLEMSTTSDCKAFEIVKKNDNDYQCKFYGDFPETYNFNNNTSMYLNNVQEDKTKTMIYMIVGIILGLLFIIGITILIIYLIRKSRNRVK
jgi:hypothetical protein